MCQNSEKSEIEPWSLRPILWVPSSSRPPCRGSKMKKLIFRFSEAKTTTATQNPDSPKPNLSAKSSGIRGHGPTSGNRPKKKSRLRTQHRHRPRRPRTTALSRRPPREGCQGCSRSEDRSDQVSQLSHQVNQGLGISHMDPNVVA